MGAACCSDKDGEIDSNIAQAPRVDPGIEEPIPAVTQTAKEPDKSAPPKDDKSQTIDYDDGTSYTGQVVDGKREGFGTYTSTSETYIGQWQNDQQHGAGKHNWTDGRAYEGQYVKGRFSGFGKMVWATDKGSMWYEGQYENDVKHGKGKFTWPNGNVYDGGWANGKRHGQANFLTSSGKQKFGFWKEDKFLHWEDAKTEAD